MMRHATERQAGEGGAGGPAAGCDLRDGWARRARLLALLLLAAGMAAGCEQQVVGTQFGHRTAADRSAPRDASGGGGSSFFGMSGEDQEAEQSDDPWAIALGRFEGQGHQKQARQAADRLSSAAEFADVWVANEGDRSMVYHGRYKGPDSDEARRDLRRWQALRQRGVVPAEVVMLVPLIDETESSNPSHDLRSVAGEDDAEYTLQIGFYDERFGEGYRQAAEEAVAQLREDGHRAFYYHGPNRSMVTVGVFKSNAVTIGRDGMPRFNEQIRRLQKEFPHNFGNGRTLTVKRGEDQSYKQPSFPVRIPEGEGSMRMSGGTAR